MDVLDNCNDIFQIIFYVLNEKMKNIIRIQLMTWNCLGSYILIMNSQNQKVQSVLNVTSLSIRKKNANNRTM